MAPASIFKPSPLNSSDNTLRPFGSTTTSTRLNETTTKPIHDDDDDDRVDELSFATVLHLLELASSTHQPLSPKLERFLQDHVSTLQKPFDPFKRTTSYTTSLVKNKPKRPDQDEDGTISQMSNRFQLDQIKASSILSIMKREYHPFKFDQEGWDQLTAFVFEERIAVLAIVALLLRTQDDPDIEKNPVHQLSTQLLPSILTPDFASSILKAFTQRTRDALPEQVRTSPTHSLFWSKQLIREQKALLEILFLVFYSPVPPDGPTLVLVLETIRDTHWGQEQRLFGYFDHETRTIVTELSHLLTILAIESFNLEQAIEIQYPIPQPSDKELPLTSIYHANNLKLINERIEAIVQLDGEKASPVLFGWAFLLSRVTSSLIDRGVPESYHDFASQSLRVEVGSRSNGPQPLYQLYAAHALSSTSNLFTILQSILTSSLLGLSNSLSTSTNEPNAVGYLSVLRGLITSLPLLVKLSFLTPEQLSAHFKVFSLLFGNRSSAILCAQFWQDQRSELLGPRDEEEMMIERTNQMNGEFETVSLAQSRFPIQFTGFIEIVKSLSSGISGLLPIDSDSEPVSTIENELLANQCTNTAFEWLNQLKTLTCIVPSTPSITPLPYEVASYPEVSYRTIRPIKLSNNLELKIGTKGKLVSQQGQKPVVVCWQFDWSAWKLFGDVLENYSTSSTMMSKGSSSAKGNDKGVNGDVFRIQGMDHSLPIEWEDQEAKENDVVAILDLFRTMLRNDPSLGTTLIEHVSSNSISGQMDEEKEEEEEEETRFDFFQILFRILDRVLAVQRSVMPIRLVSSSIELIAALLPSYPGVCWTLIRGSTFLFPSASNESTSSWHREGGSILANEKLLGSYDITLALLSLVRALVLEKQITSVTISEDFKTIKSEVLMRCFRWIRDEVWPCFNSWRYVDLGQKYEIAKRIIQLYSLLLEEAEVTTPNQFGSVIKIVVEALLTRATIGQLTPLLTIVSNGPEPIIILRKAIRYAEAQISEDLVNASLSLLRKLLRIRRRIESMPSSSLLEKLSLSHSSSEGLTISSTSSSRSTKPEWLESLAQFIISPVDSNVAMQAAKVVTSLVLGSGEWEPRPPSLIMLLGGAKRSEKWVTEVLKIVSDPLANEGLQVAIWDLISSIVETQPSLAILIVTGRHFPFSTDGPSAQLKGKQKAVEGDDGKAVTNSEESARALHKSLAPPPFKPLPRTALGVALETVGIWNEAWEEQPALLESVLRFFDFVFQHLVDYGDSLDDFRARPAPWDAFVKIAFKSSGETEPVDDEGTRSYCHRVMAKAHAVRVLALDTGVVLGQPSPASATSAKALLKALANKTQLSNALQAAIDTSCAPELQSGVYKLLLDSFPEIDVDKLRLPAQSHPLEYSREFGSGYLYSLPLLRRRLDGFMSDPNAHVGSEAFHDVIEQTGKLNLNFSLVDAQISHTRSWRQLLELALPLIRHDRAASINLLDVAAELVAKTIADEDRGGQIVLTVQNERLSILLIMIEVAQGLELSQVRNQLVVLIEGIGRIFLSETLAPIESVQRRSSPAFHPTLFRITFFTFRKLSSADRSTFSTEEQAKVVAATDVLLKSMITAMSDLFVLARASKDRDVEQDVALAVAVLSQLVNSPFVPHAVIWLAHCQAVDLFRAAFDVFVHMDQIDGKPLYAQHVLDLCLAMASSTPRAAEQMALEGLMTALTNNALSSLAEAGTISVTPHDGSSQRTIEHELWTSMLQLVVALVSALGESTQFIEHEVTGFVRLHGSQIAQTMSWTSDMSITLPGLEELSSSIALMHGVIRRAASLSSSSPNSTATEGASGIFSVAQSFAEQSLHLLQQIVYALLHPNHLANLIEPTNPEERSWIEKDASHMSDAGNDELAKRPVVAAVTLALLQLARGIVDALVIYTNAFKTLSTPPTDWNSDRAIVIPTATVSSNEKASIGTLFDLASFCLDTLRQFSSTPSTTSTQPMPITSLVHFTVQAMQSSAAQTLEGVSLLCASQLALWLSRPEKSPTRATLAIRREITGELASDLGGVLDRAGAKSTTGVGGLKGIKDTGNTISGASPEMMKILKMFVVSRLVER